MGASDIQLVQFGDQDIFLTGQPQITFFKLMYKRHTNFSMEQIPISFDIGFGEKQSVIIPPNGDLLSKCYLEVTFEEKLSSFYNTYPGYDPATYTGFNEKRDYRKFNFVEEIGHALIKSVEIEINGQIIDKHYSTWLSIWNNLTLPEEKKNGYNILIGNNSDLIKSWSEEISYKNINPYPETKICIPLQFWFCRHIGLALPLIALIYSEVKINFEFQDIEFLLSEFRNFQFRAGSSNNYQLPDFSSPFREWTGEFPENVYMFHTILQFQPTLKNANLNINYIYLDTTEKKKLINQKQEYLIEQVQYMTEQVNRNVYDNNIYYDKKKLVFNHCVKSIYWFFTYYKPWAHFQFTETGNITGKSPLLKAKIKINGHTIIDREKYYYEHVQPYKYHTSSMNRNGLYMYSFCLDPENLHPTGCINFSKCDDVYLEYSTILHSYFTNNEWYM
jgi:hypothetical protein